MHRIDADGNIANRFTDGDPAVPRPATAVDASWHNDVQEEICSVIEAAGIELAAGDQDQLHQAILTLARNSSLVQQGTARHGDAVTFPTAYVDTPAVIISGGLTNELRSKWGATGSGAESGAPYTSPTNTYEDVAALGTSPTGFTVRARLKQKGSGVVTPESIGSAATVANSPSTALNPAAANSTSASNVTSPAPAIGDSYSVKYSGSVSVTCGHGEIAPADGPPYRNSSCTATLVVAIDYSTDGSTWSEVSGARRTFTTSISSGTVGTVQTHTISPISVSVTVPGMTATGKFRARIVSLAVTYDTSYDGSATCSGSISLPASGAVTYNYSSSTTDQYASKTPDDGDTVSWVAIGHV